MKLQNWNKIKMADLEAVAREIAKLEKMDDDDLYLDDVGGDQSDRSGGKKYLSWGTSQSMRNLLSRGRARGRGRSKTKKGRGAHLLNPRTDDLNMLDNWDLEVVNAEVASLQEIGLGENNTKTPSQARGNQGKKGQIKRGSAQKTFKMGKSVFPDEEPDLGDDEKVMEDLFDIESKPRVGFGQSYDRTWTRGSRKSGFVQDESVEKEERSPGFTAHRKDPRFIRQQSDPLESRFTPSRNDPRLTVKQPDIPGSDGPEIAYAPARKDPRLVPQQVLTPRKDDPRLVARGEKQSLGSDPRLTAGKLQEAERREGFENRFGPARKDPRLAAQLMMDLQRKEDIGRTAEKTGSSAQAVALAPPGVEDSFESSENRQGSSKNVKTGEQGQTSRRGPRSPSPPPPPTTPGDHHSLSPSSTGRMWDRSPGRGRPHRDRSPSPLRRAPSPRRRMSRRDHGDSLSPRRRERSGEWRRDRRSGSRDRHERSMSPMRRSWRTSPWRRERSRVSKEWSGSPRRDRSLSPRRERSLSDRHDRSLSPRGRRSPFSPVHRSSLSSSRDEPWRQSSSPSRAPLQSHYPHMQQSYDVMAPPLQNMYSEGNYNSTAAPPAQSYGAPASGMSGQAAPGYSNYQQYGYDNYYQQAPPTYSGNKDGRSRGGRT